MRKPADPNVESKAHHRIELSLRCWRVANGLQDARFELSGEPIGQHLIGLLFRDRHSLMDVWTCTASADSPDPDDIPIGCKFSALKPLDCRSPGWADVHH